MARAVYVYVANLGLYAFDMKGKALWSAPQEAMPIYLDFGTGSSPVLADESDRHRQRQREAAFHRGL